MQKTYRECAIDYILNKWNEANIKRKNQKRKEQKDYDKHRDTKEN